MARSDLEKFQRRLALVDYFRHVFGVEDVNAPDAVGGYYDALEAQQEGYNAEGRSYVSRVLEGRVRGIRPADLLRYDANVKRHTDALNRRRTEPIKLKYFQILAALTTERYLDRVTREPEAFLDDLNAFVREQNKTRAGRIDLPTFAADDLNKLAFWMATGSGKTLLMHLNYYQYLDYRPQAADNILLVTPNAGLSEQHMAEMEKSAIPCRRFNADTGDLFSDDPRTVKVIEITKLVEEKTGGGKSVDVSHLEGRNLVFVDEGHKGAGSTAQAWRNRRAALAENGFTFEYSATFGQGVGGAGTDVEEEYGRAIIFDYSYPRFYEDGYGKDYRILNLEHDLDPALTNRYLLANLLTFYEQVRCYERHRRTFYSEHNVEPPLLTFVGHTVSAGKTWSSLGKNDMRSLSDVQALVLFLQRMLRNEGGWVPETIDAILNRESGIEREDRGDGRRDQDLFADAFPTLRQAGLDGAAIYTDMLERIFHVRQPTDLHLVALQSVEGEIGLRAGPADRVFGLINIGDADNFLKLTEERAPEIAIDPPEQFAGSLFQAINQQGSSINVLLGAKKFIEGWDSWRVSTMGLMNIGRGEGPQIIQLFGRGVRLLGKDRTLKRSEALPGDHPDHLPQLETLNIFGVRAKYMAQFRDYLADEGIDTEERETVVIPTRINDDFRGRGLLVVRPRIETPFEDVERLRLELVDACKPVIDLTMHADMLVSGGLAHERPAIYEARDARTLRSEHLDLLDWDRLYHEIWRFRAAHGYDNLAIDRQTLRRVLEEGHYELYCSPDLVEVTSFADLDRLERLALMILRKAVETYYTRAKRRWEQSQLVYQTLDEDDENLIVEYEARVRRSASEFLKTLREMRNGDALYENDLDLPPRVHFDQHLYWPLLLEDQGEEPVVKYSPPGLNLGERHFVRTLRDYLETGEGRALLERHGRELFLLRNQSRGRGVGFLVNEERFFPDFILWLQGPDRQDVVFVDPHGLIIGGNLEVNPKVQFFETIREYERELNARTGRDDIALHSYIVSQTTFEKLKTQTGVAREEVFNRDYHVYFREQPEYAASILRHVLADGGAAGQGGGT